MYRAPAAMASVGPDPYPERDADLAVLRRSAEGELRQQDPMRWTSACLALGRSEDEGAKDLLGGLVARLEASADPRDREDAALAACGLVAAGVWSAEEKVLPLVDTTEPVARVVRWYAQAAAWRDGRGDPEARDRLRRLWYGRAQPYVGDLRSTIATWLFLQDRLATGDELYDAFVRDLTAGGTRVVDQVVGQSVRLRRGEADAAVEILRIVREPEAHRMPEGSASVSPDPAHPAILGMRALHLYAVSGR
jgi:hypothetical protein